MFKIPVDQLQQVTKYVVKKDKLHCGVASEC